MTLRVKFARMCRQILTPVRKYLIIKKIKSRVQDAHFMQHCKENKITFKLVFMYKIRETGRPFGVALALKQGTDTIRGCILRCGCYYLGWSGACLSEASQLHKGVTSHGRLLQQVEPTPSPTEPRRRARSSGNENYDRMVEAMRQTANVSKLIRQVEETTIIKPQRAKRGSRGIGPGNP